MKNQFFFPYYSKVCLIATLIISIFQLGFSQNTSNHGNKFEQIDPLLPSPNNYRSMDGAPGIDYWQQKCDYDIDCTLDTKNQRLTGQERITYTNNSPNDLRYL